jgi:hypothetical protein
MDVQGSFVFETWGRGFRTCLGADALRKCRLYGLVRSTEQGQHRNRFGEADSLLVCCELLSGLVRVG